MQLFKLRKQIVSVSILRHHSTARHFTKIVVKGMSHLTAAAIKNI